MEEAVAHEDNSRIEDCSANLYRQMDAKDSFYAKPKVIPPWAVEASPWNRLAAHAHQNSAQTRIDRTGHPARDGIEDRFRRILSDPNGENHHRSAWGHAAFSLSQSLRALLARQGVSVHIVLPGPIDTDMIRNLDVPKTSPESVARAIFDGVEKGDEEIFPDPMSEAIAEGWRNSALKALQRQFAAYVAQTPVKSNAAQ